MSGNFYEAVLQTALHAPFLERARTRGRRARALPHPMRSDAAPRRSQSLAIREVLPSAREVMREEECTLGMNRRTPGE